MALRWYVVHAFSGFEKKVAQSIREQVEKKGLQDKIPEVLVPTEEVTEIKNGNKVKSERKFFPGYVLVKMEWSEDLWHLIKNTPKVTGFLGGTKERPVPITDAEAAHILHQVESGVEKPKSTLTFDVGEEVRVTDGPFTTFVGVVEEVDAARTRLKVSVSIFGRATPVELDFTQVAKIN